MTTSAEPRGGSVSLADLGLSPADVAEMEAGDFTLVFNLLYHWGDQEELLACIDAVMPVWPRRVVSLLDWRVQALLALGRTEEAVSEAHRRLEANDSFTGRRGLIRAHIAAGQLAGAEGLISAMIEENREHTVAWQALAELELARGEPEAALTALRQLNQLNPGSRAYLMGMVEAHEARGDWVTATGYAVGLMESAAEVPLSLSDLQRLSRFFAAAGETTRVADIEEELGRRRAEVLERLQAVVAGSLMGPEEPEPTPEVEGSPAGVTLESLRVTEGERARVEEGARRLFGFERLLPGQLETMVCALRGEDVLTVLPTGGGKSLCYQLPAMLDETGTTLVVSPLIALMQDQFAHLPENVRHLATFVNSTLEGDELRARLNLTVGGRFRLMYAAPERLRQPPFLHALRRAGVNRLVVDEAHCVSVWGHDFRPDYLAIGKAREVLGRPPLLGLTATAPERVRRDIMRHLGEMKLVVGEVTRPNLRLEATQARDLDEKLGHLLTFCRQESGSGIVYGGTRRRCEELAELLRAQGVDAAFYHAGLYPEEREAVQQRFMAGETRVIVATIAFGMGIDKPDIRFVVHFGLPASVESYYQEAGRAGRDGLPARCMLLHSTADKGTLTRQVRRDALSLEFVQSVYEAVRQRVNGSEHGQLALADLLRDLQSEEVPVRVALGLLERADLLEREQDAPRSLTIRLRSEGLSADEPAFVAFREAVRLRPGQSLTLTLAETSRRSGLSLADVEPSLRQWFDAGWLSFYTSGRDPLFRLLPEPSDLSARLGGLLEDHDRIQSQRVDDIVRYARTRRCRQDYLSRYLGGRGIKGCRSCDNCVPMAVPADCLPSEAEQLQAILRCMQATPWGWGRANLQRILRSEPDAPPAGQENPEFGALAFRSQAALGKMLDDLERAGFLASRRLDHGGAVVELTKAGVGALEDPAALERLVRPGPAPRPRKTEPVDLLPADEALFERLRAWRGEEAQRQGVPPYVVFPDSVLREIAARRPASEAQLAAIKGIGPHKLARYGEAVLAMVRDHAPASATMSQPARGGGDGQSGDGGG